eukprot:SAG11_NODE_604_length_8248_cov_6.574251_4_plen_87_part_00
MLRPVHRPRVPLTTASALGPTHPRNNLSDHRQPPRHPVSRPTVSVWRLHPATTQGRTSQHGARLRPATVGDGRAPPGRYYGYTPPV